VAYQETVSLLCNAHISQRCHGKNSETWDEVELNRVHQGFFLRFCDAKTSPNFDFGCDHSNASATRCRPRLGEETNVAVAEPWKPQFFGDDMYPVIL